MAVEADFAYLNDMIDLGYVEGPVLEVGSRSWQGSIGNAKELCSRRGIAWTGADLVDGPGVDLLLDILDEEDVLPHVESWKTVLLFNILEHVYDPPSALRNAMRLVSPGGCCLIVSPTVWQIHGFPKDYWRPLPEFYEEFARREGFDVIANSRRWLVVGRAIDHEELARDGEEMIPSYHASAQLWGRRRAGVSRLVHWLTRSFGRETPFPMSGYGVAFRKSGSPTPE